MVSNETQTFVIQMFDYALDYNIKLLIFGTFIFYAFLFYFMLKDMEINTIFKAFFKFFATIYIWLTTFFMPFSFGIMMFREYDAISLWTLIVQLYGGVFVLLLLVGIVYGWTRILAMFHIDFDFAEHRNSRTRQGERE